MGNDASPNGLPPAVPLPAGPVQFSPPGSSLPAASRGDGGAVLMPAQDSPCFVKALQSAAGTATLGFLFGWVPAMVRNKLRQPGLWWAEGLRSARSFALMSGVYAWVACLAQRVRRTEDGVNRGLAGCATGLVLGWNGPNPPLLAAQTCLGLGALSYFVDLAPAASTPPAQAATLSAVARSAAGESADSLQRAAGQPCISSCCQLNLLPSGAALPSRRTAGATSSHPLLAFADAASGRLSGVLARRGGGWDDLDEGAATALWAARLPPVLALAQAAHADYFR